MPLPLLLPLPLLSIVFNDIILYHCPVILAATVTSKLAVWRLLHVNRAQY